jgi:hypothetical protein
LAAELTTVIKKTHNDKGIPHVSGCQCKSHRPARWRNIVAREEMVIEMGTVCGRCMRYDHCINPHVDQETRHTFAIEANRISRYSTMSKGIENHSLIIHLLQTEAST